MTNIEINLPSTRGKYLSDVGDWLETQMPNPPINETQRWTLVTKLITDDNGKDIDYKYMISFNDDYDATMFALRWMGGNSMS